MNVVPPPTQLINVDEQEKKDVEAIAKEVGFAVDKKTGLFEIQPVSEQHPLTAQTQKDIEKYNYEQEPVEKDSKLGFFIPALRKSTRTTKALHFLGKKMEWMRKKGGGEVVLK